MKIALGGDFHLALQRAEPEIKSPDSTREAYDFIDPLTITVTDKNTQTSISIPDVDDPFFETPLLSEEDESSINRFAPTEENLRNYLGLFDKIVLAMVEQHD